MAQVQVADVVVPETFTPYVQQITEQRANLVRTGVITRDPSLDGLLVPGGVTFNVPSWRDLADDADNVSTDNPASDSTPQNIQTSQEIAVRLSRNQSWSSMDLAQALAGSDPVAAIGGRVGYYWARRLQAGVIAYVTGLFADNAAAPTGTDTHTQDDMTNDVSGVSFIAGVTDFTSAAFIDTLATMNEAEEDLGAVFVHPTVYARMRKNNLIDFVSDAVNVNAAAVPTFLGKRVIQDKAMPNVTDVYETWIMGQGAVRWGVGTPRMATEVDRSPAAGDGGGQETLFNRIEWLIHAPGHAYIGTAASGGPSNAATANNLAAAASWSRIWPEREQIKIARLFTREA